ATAKAPSARRSKNTYAVKPFWLRWDALPARMTAATYLKRPVRWRDRMPLLRRRWRRHQLLVLRVCPLERGAFIESAHIGHELRRFRQEIDQQAQAQGRADHDVGSGELLAHQVAPSGHALGGHVHRGLEIAIAQRGPPRLLLARIGAIGHRRLNAAWAEEQPLEIDAAARIANRHAQARLGKRAGEITAERHGLGESHIVLAQRRDAGH